MAWAYHRIPPEDDPSIPHPITKYDQIIESPDDSSGSLTFGIELEFMVPILRSGLIDPFPEDRRPLFKYPAYSDIDILVLDVIEGACDIPFRLELEDKFRRPSSNVIRYDMWRLIKDHSLKFQKVDRHEHTWVGREITSEVFNSDEPKDYTEKITKVCHAIRQLRVHLNQTTSVHVHVGLGDEPFSLLTIKKAMTLILLADDMLMGLHHPARRESPHCRLISLCSELGRWLPEFARDKKNILKESLEQRMGEFVPDIPAAKQTLQATKSFKELARMMDDPVHDWGYYRGSVSFARFLPDEDDVGGNTQTIEFRQMAGCLEPGEIIHWAKVCIAIVDFARLSDAGRYKGLLKKLMPEDSTFSAFDLLLELGLVEEEKYFRAKVQGYQSNLDFYPGESSGGLFVPELE
ncbi:putative amidoligase enzyme-domain-containing protein [Annulohypoxylon truncatum]|uniref:putative amidoligase enzyme-domain-containing protein n=1 Tax=Annulohypoxylon truncatum TaxID=327061 RepID=UPI00200860F9|nr:putative amidoligase enzyme-domain-containing protein [Annulohypoxylon truncatum]KAI1205503.1 putative amidoligase enzyme-domain-containing protein [Annulohypoxylon truncatum]